MVTSKVAEKYRIYYVNKGGGVIRFLQDESPKLNVTLDWGFRGDICTFRLKYLDDHVGVYVEE